MPRIRHVTPVLIAVVALGVCPRWVSAQHDEPCLILCAPELKIEPTFTFEPIFRRPTIETLVDGVVIASEKPKTEAVFELVLVVDVPTQIPRVGLSFETVFVPFGESDINAFTGTTAAQLGRESIRDNDIQFEFEVQLGWLKPEQTGGWLESHFDIVDKFSRSELPGDASAYTHKLNFELDTAVLLFHWLPEGNWLKNVEIEGSLDYVATGLPTAGDVIHGTERFLEDASPWSFSLVFVLPLAPLAP